MGNAEIVFLLLFFFSAALSYREYKNKLLFSLAHQFSCFPAKRHPSPILHRFRRENIIFNSIIITTEAARCQFSAYMLLSIFGQPGRCTHTAAGVQNSKSYRSMTLLYNTVTICLRRVYTCNVLIWTDEMI